jgi:lysophospholipase
VFSSEQAQQLRRSLSTFSFTSAAPSSALIQSYKSHYGLNFDDLDIEITHTLGKFTSGELQIACQYFTPSKTESRGTVIPVHGYFDHVGIYNHLIEHCLSQGLAVLTFDLPGHGLSSGEIAGIDSFDQYSAVLSQCIEMAQQQQLTRPWFLMGQSTGAATVINSLLHDPNFSYDLFEKIILLAPLVRPLDWRRASVLYSVFHLFVKKTKRDFKPNSHDQEFSKFIFADDPLQSRHLAISWVRSLKQYLSRFEASAECDAAIHIVQGTKDSTVDWQYNLPALKKKFPNTHVTMIDGAQHHMVNEKKSIREEIFAAIDSVLRARG